jgi:mannan endo-1,4-beta-mannosidase
MNFSTKTLIIFLFLSQFVFAKTAKSQGDTMYVDGRHIYSAAGEKVILRGVNEMFIWGNDKTGSWTLPEIAKTGANCVRLAWGKDVSSAQLAKLIDNCVANKMIAMPECHDATGNWAGLHDCIMFWKNPVIFNAVQKNKKWTLLNVGNEVGDGNVTSSMFLKGYKGAIDSLRGWGYTVPIVIDAPTWGQNVDVLFATWKELLNYDPLKNVVFSAHSYWASSSNYQRIATKSVNENMPVIIGEGPSPTAYPNCKILDYKTGLDVCGKNEIGWLIWSWGMLSNGHCVPNFDVTTNGRFGNWETQYSEIMAVSHPYSLMRTAERPASFFTDSIVPVSGLEFIANSTNIIVGDSAKIEVILSPANALVKKYSMVLVQSKEVLKLSVDSSSVIGIGEGVAAVQVSHAQTGIKRTINFNVTLPVSVSQKTLPDVGIKVFPNPADNQLTVKLPVQTDVNASISDANGAIVEQISSQGDFSVNIEKYKSGIYFIQIEYFDETGVYKFIKK